MADTDKIVEQLSGLTVLEIAGLVKQLEEKWGVSAAAPVAMAAAPAAGGGGAAAPAAEEKTTFEVILKEMGTNKIGVIKEVRSAVPGLGLAEAKALVEGAPKTIKEGVTKAEADEMKKKIEAGGAKVENKELKHEGAAVAHAPVGLVGGLGAAEVPFAERVELHRAVRIALGGGMALS